MNKILKYIVAIDPIVLGFEAHGWDMSKIVEDYVSLSKFFMRNLIFYLSLAYLD